jgi:hypothetical protein
MRTVLVQVLRSTFAAVGGYAVIAVATTLGFEAMLGGIGYHKSSAATLAVAGIVAIVSGLAGGFVAAWIGGRAPVWHASSTLVFLTVDTVYVLSRGGPDPVWFDAAGSLTLMAAAVAGGYLYRAVRPAPRAVGVAV